MDIKAHELEEGEDGLWCPRCGNIFHDEDIARNPCDYYICPKCFVIQHSECRCLPLDRMSKLDADRLYSQVQIMDMEQLKKLWRWIGYEYHLRLRKIYEQDSCNR